MITALHSEYALRDGILRDGALSKTHGSNVNGIARMSYLVRDISREAERYANEPTMHAYYRDLRKQARLTVYALKYLI